ncbi:transcription factor E2F7 [Sardina pilchardus]|uniref:transcription factor E2F7 n=1 Tax=Sardina pilchardus TaxID=27697 RepID=UPI002E14EAF6
METDCLTLNDLISPRKGRTAIEDDFGKNDQKENVRLERRKVTPHKSDVASTSINGKKAPASEFIHITPIKHPDRAHPDPWTPTANLKMLISAASPDIRDREIKKILFRPIENEEKLVVVEEEEEDAELDDSCQFDVVEDCGDEFEKRPSRKQKSLGLLCQKFLALYPDYPASSETISISLDEVATSLGVERRRIYDIVNVLESLMLVSRMAKNQYVWHGRPRLSQTLQELQQQGRRQRYHLQMEQTTAGAAACGGPAQRSEEGDGSYATACRRKDKSLRIMSQKFVMLFLVSKTLTVTLDTAAKILIEESQDAANHSKYKTKVRRLYDIANVLTSLSLIKKVHVREEKGRKPAFKWIGPADFVTSTEDSVAVSGIPLPQVNADAHLTVPAGRREKFTRHASFQVVPTSAANLRLTNSAPSTPNRENSGHRVEPLDFSRKLGSSSAVCRRQFGEAPGLQTPVGQRCSPQVRSPGLAPLAVPISIPEGAYSLPTAPHGVANATAYPQHHLTYLPSLSQPSILMLYGGPAPEGPHPSQGQGQGSSPRAAEVREKRKSVDDDMEPRQAGKRERREDEQKAEPECAQHSSRAPTHCLQLGVPVSEALSRDEGESRSPAVAQPASHYLYVPNSAGLNFLLSTGHSAGGVALSPGSMAMSPGAMSSLAVPYVLVPSSALSSYPAAALLANGAVDSSHIAHAPGIGFNVPTMMSPAHFVVSPGSFALAGASPSAALSAAQEQHSFLGVSPIPASPATAQRQPDRLHLTDPHTPLTPKEAMAPGSKAFFQTPGTLGGTPVTLETRKRGSAQRRLDIGNPVAN